MIIFNYWILAKIFKIMDFGKDKEAHQYSPIKYVLFQPEVNPTKLTQSSFLRILTLIALLIEVAALIRVIYEIPAFVFIAYHWLGLIWSLLYLVFPSLTGSLVYKFIAHLFSTLYLMIGILNAFLYFDAIFSRDKEFFLWLLLMFSGPPAIVSAAMLLLMNFESSESCDIKKNPKLILLNGNQLVQV